MNDLTTKLGLLANLTLSDASEAKVKPVLANKSEIIYPGVFSDSNVEDHTYRGALAFHTRWKASFYREFRARKRSLRFGRSGYSF